MVMRYGEHGQDNRISTVYLAFGEVEPVRWTGERAELCGAAGLGVYGAATGTNRLGQYYCWNRTYDINTGRWTTPDPVATPWWNLWDYCGCVPTISTDPTGLSGGILIKNGKHVTGVPLTREDIPKGTRWIDVHDPHQELHVTSKSRVKLFLLLRLFTLFSGREYASPLFVRRHKEANSGDEEEEGPVGPIIVGDEDSVGGRFEIPAGCDVRGTVHTHPSGPSGLKCWV